MADDDDDLSSDGDGWLTTKKRGRDDDKIEADRAKAILERRMKRNPNYKPKSPKKKSKADRTNKKAKASRKKSSRQSDSEEEDNAYENESFIEEDSAEDEVGDDNSDDDDDDGDSTDLDGEKPWNEKDEEEVDDEEDDDEVLSNDHSSGSDEDGTFFKTYQPRSSIPPASLKRNQKQLPRAEPKTTSSARARRKQSTTTETIELMSSDDSDGSNAAENSRPRKATPRKAKRTPSENVANSRFTGGDDDSDQSHDADSDTDLPPSKPQARRLSKAANKKAVSTLADDSDDSDDEILSASRLGQPPRPKVAPANKPNTAIDDDNLASPSPVLNRRGKKNPTKLQHNKKSRYLLDDDDSDGNVPESEALAMALAMSASESQTNNGQKSMLETALADTDTIDLLDSDIEVDQVGNDEQDDFIDPEAQEAGSVLETANALSKEILTTMLLWMNGDDSNQDAEPNAKATVPMGMIVDGALAMSTVSTLKSSRASENKSWISKETMQSVCPNVVLADYQLVGVNWLALMHGMRCTVKGSMGKQTSVNGVLSDDMGLGKTVQTIAFLAWLKYTSEQGQTAAGRAKRDPSHGESDGDSIVVMETRPVRPHLIVVPSSVVSNWMREFEMFAPHLNVVKYYGDQIERQELQDMLRCHLPGAQRLPGTPAIDAIVVPISYFSSERSDDRNFLRKFRLEYLIVDEAHLLKNARGLRYKNLDKFSSSHRLLLSGTPVQNNPKELLALLCFLMPLFSSRKYKSYEEDDGKVASESMLQHFVELEKGENGTKALAYRKLKQLFAPFVLRRKKVDVLGQLVPPKTVQVEFVELDLIARSLYDSIIADHIRAKKEGAYKDMSTHLFTQLRKAAHHPLLIRSRHKEPLEKQELARLFYMYQAFQGGTLEQVSAELDNYNDFDIHYTALELAEQNSCRRESLEPYILQEEDIFCSTKFVRLKSLLPELISAGHRILIFSVWTSCLDLLGCLLEAIGIDFLRMDGSTPVKERQDLMDRYQKDSSIPVFLLSTRACGLGVNLTAADVCIMHDISFNPSDDWQAEDRCHRIGQTKPVTVVKLVAKSTVDEDIYNIQTKKMEMNHAIMESDAWTKEADNDKNDVLQAAIDRYLHAPAENTKTKFLNNGTATDSKNYQCT